LGLSTLGLDVGCSADASIALTSKEAGPARRRAAAPMCWRRLGSTSSLDLRYRHVFLNESPDSAYSILSTTMAAPLVHCFLVSCDFSIWGWFRLQIFATHATVALSFVFGNYCPIVN
jgi:hypothetical protein